ncbi:MAG: porin [Saprospiraceae bacterium]|nr:porin [Saprospiraceae bacterium]
MLLRLLPVAFALTCAFQSAVGQTVTPDTLPPQKTPVSTTSTVLPPSKWYDKIGLRGYAQFRYNRLLETNPDLKCEQCDKSIGKGQSFAFRRARLVLSGDVHKRFFVYIQFDYSADASATSKHFLQVRDAYFDYVFDKKKEYRLRFGQSKVPFGFENLQSSSNRLPLDRSDALNSAAANERDFGAFFMYAPAKIRELIKNVSNDALKGSNDYGVFAFGLYNGQTANKPELNDYLHAVARLSYPFKIGTQIIEPGVQAYSGKFSLAKDQLSPGAKAAADLTYTDRRMAGSLVLYPQPFGILAEYNVGESPSFDAAIDSIRVQKLKGGFVTASYRSKLGKGFIMPYARYQVYDGAKKHELDARRYDMNELELGFEWQPIKNLEVTLAYVISQRKYSDFKTDYDEKGNFLRIQMQANY